MRSTAVILTYSFTAIAASLFSLPTLAEDRPKILEIRAGAFFHDPKSPEKGSIDGNFEFLAPRVPIGVNKIYEFLIPRPHIGATLNTANKTSDAYAGLTWNYNLTNSVFVEATFGGAANNGKTGQIVVPGHNAMGCATSFRESVSFGYRISSAFSIMGTIEHMSNAGLCDRNRGLTNGGIRLGYSF